MRNLVKGTYFEGISVIIILYVGKWCISVENYHACVFPPAIEPNASLLRISVTILMDAVTWSDQLKTLTRADSPCGYLS
jgi:hypothetical protein